MTLTQLKKKHPKIHAEIMRRGISAERMRALAETKSPEESKFFPVIYGKLEHFHLIEKELPLLA
jgi:hypothetical protein